MYSRPETLQGIQFYPLEKKCPCGNKYFNYSILDLQGGRREVLATCSYCRRKNGYACQIKPDEVKDKD